jgi:hypothetical protein
VPVVHFSLRAECKNWVDNLITHTLLFGTICAHARIVAYSGDSVLCKIPRYSHIKSKDDIPRYPLKRIDNCVSFICYYLSECVNFSISIRHKFHGKQRRFTHFGDKKESALFLISIKLFNNVNIIVK